MSGPIAADVIRAFTGTIDAAFSGALQVPAISIILLDGTLLSSSVGR
jgi:hypothetical protein